MTNHPGRLRLFAYSITLATTLSLIAACAVSAEAQSGRRARKPTVVTPPPPEPSPEVKKPVQETKPSLTFIIGSDRHESFSYIPSYFSDSVMRACADRLDDAPSVRVDVVHRDINRGEAIKRAKEEKEAFVVWLQLRTEYAAAGRTDLNELYLEYWLFAPTTGKTTTTGRVYQQAYSTGPVIVGPRTTGRTSAAYTEILLKRAAREAAERILAAMRDGLPRVPVPS